MNTEKFLSVYNESRNGANGFFRHPLCSNFAYSDGVQECAEAGCYWLLDILATELPRVMRGARENLVTVTVTVKKGKAKITASGSGDVLLPWKKSISWTDLPEGKWVFLLADEQAGSTPFKIILVSEY